MNTSTYTAIDYDWLTKPTGDPFANAGGYALKVFSETFPEDDILQLISRATDIYVDRWNSKLDVFFLNSKITQKSFNPQRKKDETKKYFTSLLNDIDAKVGFCRISGRNTSIFPAGRDNSILSGSGKFVNFHHFLDNGIMLSKEILIRLFFLPLGIRLMSGNKVCVIDSNNFDVSVKFAESNCNTVLADIAKNCSEGVLKSPSAAPSTELFRFADRIIKDSNEIDEDCSLTLYLFTNLGAKPNLAIYTLPFEGMRFYRFVNSAKYRDDWNSFIATKYFSYDYKKAEYNNTTGKYLYDDKKKGNQEIEEDQFKYWKNFIYESFINGVSILPEILKWSKDNRFNFNIVKFYEKKVRKMKNETISKIEQMADFIFEANNNGVEEIHKVIKELNNFSESFDLRRFILKKIVEKFNEIHGDEATPIISVKDYTNYLFPDINSWKETRDVLIIALYQKLHELNEVNDNEPNNIE